MPRGSASARLLRDAARLATPAMPGGRLHPRGHPDQATRPGRTGWIAQPFATLPTTSRRRHPCPGCKSGSSSVTQTRRRVRGKLARAGSRPMCRIVLMCGPAGSGKSTCARGLERHGLTRLSLDVRWAMRDLITDGGVEGGEEEEGSRSYLLALVKVGRDVVLDLSLLVRHPSRYPPRFHPQRSPLQQRGYRR